MAMAIEQRMQDWIAAGPGRYFKIRVRSEEIYVEACEGPNSQSNAWVGPSPLSGFPSVAQYEARLPADSALSDVIDAAIGLANKRAGDGDG